MPRTDGAGFLMGSLGERPSKKKAELAPGDNGIQAAVDFLDSCSESVFHLSKGLAQFAAGAKALVEGPLTMDCIVVLLQAEGSLPKTPGGRPQPANLIRAVLEAAAGLGDRFLKSDGTSLAELQKRDGVRYDDSIHSEEVDPEAVAAREAAEFARWKALQANPTSKKSRRTRR